MAVHLAQTSLCLNRFSGEILAPLQARLDQMDVSLLGTIPADEQLMEFEFSGRPLIELGDESPVYTAVSHMLQQINL